jgi:hypothetical protein
MGSPTVKDNYPNRPVKEFETMTSTLADTLGVLNHGLPPALISPEHITRINAVAHCLPAALTTFFGFECRLGDERPQADFLLYVTATEGGRDILAGAAPAALLLEPLQANPIWRRLRHFCQSWAEPTSLLHRHVQDLWLEFDIAGASTDPPLPSCFFRPHFPAGDTGKWITTTAIPMLRGQALPTSVEQNLLAALDNLPAEAHVFQVGIMLARQAEAVRLCLRNIGPAQILPYLTRLGWSEPVSQLDELISHLSRWVDRIDLDLDIGQTILPKIGLECYFDGQRQPQLEPRWYSFLDFLVDSGLCRPAKREGLLTYPGYIREKKQAAWPPRLRAASSLLGGRYEIIFFKGLHHVKIVYQPACPLEAKAYLYVSQNWLALGQPVAVNQL